MEAQLLTRLYNNTLQRVRRHTRYVSRNDLSKCYFLPEFDEGNDYACEFVSNTSSCNDFVQIFDYLHFMICTLKLKKNPVGIASMLTIAASLLLFHLAWLYVMGKYFLVPNIITIAERLNMVGFEFGVTFVSIALGFPDIVESFLLCEYEIEYGSLMISQTFGKVISCFTMGIAVISFSQMNSVPPKSIPITSMLLIGCFIYMMQLFKYKIHEDMTHIRIHGAIFLCIYAMYLIYSVITERTRKRISHVSALMELYRNKFRKEPQLIKKNSWQQFVYTINPFAHIANLSKMTILLLMPIWTVQAILIPVVDDKRPHHGWCKSLACISFITFPFVLKLSGISNRFFSIFSLIGLCLAALTLLVTSCNQKPKYHIYYALFGTFVMVFIYHIIDYEKDALLWQILMYVADIKSDVIAVLVFPLGDCMIEWVVCITLISRGYTRMSAGIVLGNIMFTCFTGLPVLVFKPCYDPLQHVTITANTVTTCTFCIIILVFSSLNLSLTNFQLRRSNGIYIIILYGCFVLYIILSLLYIVHPYGTTHSVLASNDYLQVDWA